MWRWSGLTQLGIHPQQPKVSVFITSSLCPTTDKHLFQKPKQRFNQQSQYTTHIYSTKQTSKNTKMGKIPRNVPTWWASEIHFLRRPAEVRWNPLSSMSGRESAGSVQSTGEKSSDSPGVREGVGRSRESRPRGILGIRVLHFFTSQVHFRDFDFFLRLTMKWFKFFCLKYLSFSF